MKGILLKYFFAGGQFPLIGLIRLHFIPAGPGTSINADMTWLSEEDRFSGTLTHK